MGMRKLIAIALFGAAAAATAQSDRPAAPATPPAAAAPAAPVAPPLPAVSIEDAYRREFAFLEAQKRELQNQIAATNTRFEADQTRLNREINALEGRVLAARNEAEAKTRELTLADQQQISIDASTELLAATFSQAEASLAGFGTNLASDESYRAGDDASRLTRLFQTANAKLADFGRVRSAPGSFFLADGREVQGTLTRLGNVAIFGSSPDGGGALAPAGGGAFKVWDAAPSSEAATALAAGQNVSTLPLFLFENEGAAVERPVEQTLWTWMGKGGPIGYVIMALGLIGLVLAILRAIFLHRAGANVKRITDGVNVPLREGRIADAIEAAKRHKGSAARVVTAALRNISRDREHLEDIISESILHESGHLNRFGPIILLVAGVAPLLGLLGTVTGMIQTFDVITEFGTSDPKLLSGGISVALVTTEQGLIVAIPMLLLGNLLNGWAERIKDDMEAGALKVVNVASEARAALATLAARPR